MKLSTTVAADALLPVSAAAGPPAVLANLQQMKLTAYSGTALQVDAGMTAPAGGGFEVPYRNIVVPHRSTCRDRLKDEIVRPTTF